MTIKNLDRKVRKFKALFLGHFHDGDPHQKELWQMHWQGHDIDMIPSGLLIHMNSCWCRKEQEL